MQEFFIHRIHGDLFFKLFYSEPVALILITVLLCYGVYVLSLSRVGTQPVIKTISACLSVVDQFHLYCCMHDFLSPFIYMCIVCPCSVSLAPMCFSAIPFTLRPLFNGEIHFLSNSEGHW